MNPLKLLPWIFILTAVAFIFQNNPAASMMAALAAMWVGESNRWEARYKQVYQKLLDSRFPNQ
jgi:hypothetical protein